QMEQYEGGAERAGGCERDGRELGGQRAGCELTGERWAGAAVRGDRARLVLVRAAGNEPGQWNRVRVGGRSAPDPQPWCTGGPVLDFHGGRRIEPQVQRAED